MVRLKNNLVKRFCSLVLCIVMIANLVACSNEAPSPVVSNNEAEVNTEEKLTEKIEVESEEAEKIINEVITEEIYLEEIVEVEDKVSEVLLSENEIEEVLMCKTIYIPEDHIEEFSENSQLTQVFGEDFNLKPVLKKISIGTGVILTLTILRKVGISGALGSVVSGAAEQSLEFGKKGAIIGSLFGALTGATDEIDKSGRTSAIIGFAASTAGLILAGVGLITAIPSGGSSTLVFSEGIKLCLAGVSLLSATGVTVASAKNAIETFESTDGFDVDWDNIDWSKVGESSVQKSIENAADGYMFGSIVGAVYGGVKGYEFFHKYGAPYSKLEARIQETPIDNEFGKWTGERGESEYVFYKDKPITIGNKTYLIKSGTKIMYKNGIPDFSKVAKAEIKINLKKIKPTTRYPVKKDADQALADYWTKIRYNGKSWTAREIEQYRSDNGLTWHEMNNMEYVQLVPTEINGAFGHLGGMGEYNAMIGKEGVSDFD